jgi:hypothetical protein
MVMYPSPYLWRVLASVAMLTVPAFASAGSTSPSQIGPAQVVSAYLNSWMRYQEVPANRLVSRRHGCHADLVKSHVDVPSSTDYARFLGTSFHIGPTRTGHTIATVDVETSLTPVGGKPVHGHDQYGLTRAGARWQLCTRRSSGRLDLLGAYD